MSPREIFDEYRRERRHGEIAGFRHEALPALTRYTACDVGADGFVMFAQFGEADAEKIITEQIEHFAAHRQGFEWKVYDFDEPASLKALLEARGFSCEQPECFMVLDVAAWPEVRSQARVTIERISRVAELDGFVALEGAIWGEDPIGHLERYTRQLESEGDVVAIYCAKYQGTPVGTGRVTMRSDRRFADLNGGGVLESHRGRGIFTALLDRRIKEAKARGCRWVAVDAGPMSRPILLRKGFQPICWTYPMMKRVTGSAK